VNHAHWILIKIASWRETSPVSLPLKNRDLCAATGCEALDGSVIKAHGYRIGTFFAVEKTNRQQPADYLSRRTESSLLSA